LLIACNKLGGIGKVVISLEDRVQNKCGNAIQILTLARAMQKPITLWSHLKITDHMPDYEAKFVLAVSIFFP